jgi:hypothetical protein
MDWKSLLLRPSLVLRWCFTALTSLDGIGDFSWMFLEADVDKTSPSTGRKKLPKIPLNSRLPAYSMRSVLS